MFNKRNAFIQQRVKEFIKFNNLKQKVRILNFHTFRYIVNKKSVKLFSKILSSLKIFMRLVQNTDVLIVVLKE